MRDGMRRLACVRSPDWVSSAGRVRPGGPFLEISMIESVAGTGIGAELLPQLAEFKSLRDPMPESIELHEEFGASSGRGRGRARRGLGGRGIHYALSEQTL